MSPSAKKLCWTIAQFSVCILAFGTFFVFAPWLAAVEASEAPATIAASLPIGCPAFIVNHGQYTCFWYGTLSQNPVGFSLCALLFFACWGFLLFTGITRRGFSFRPFHEWFRRGRHTEP
jgi:hypothetical protein